MKKRLWSCLISAALFAGTVIPTFAEFVPGTDEMKKGTTDWGDPTSYVYNNSTGIPDEGLYLAAAKSGGGDDGLLTVGEAQEMSFLHANYESDGNSSSLPIRDLSGIEKLMNLNELELDFNEITDIERLSPLKRLDALWLSGNPIEDMNKMLDTIADFPNIKIVSLSGYGLTSLQKLNGCHNLEELWLDKNNLNNQALSDIVNWFPRLNVLRIADNPQITDIRILTKVKDTLTGLRIGARDTESTPLKTKAMDTVSQLTQLRWFEADNIDIPDFSAFQELTGMKDLHLQSNNMTSLAGIENLTALETLDLSQNLLEDVSAIENFPQLYWFNFSNNPLSKLPDLTGFRNLRLWYLSLSQTNLSASELREKLPAYLQADWDWESWQERNAADGSETDFTPWPEDMARPPEPGPGVPAVYEVSPDTFLMFDREGPQVSKVEPRGYVSTDLKAATEKIGVTVSKGFDITVVDENGTELHGQLPYTLTMKIYDKSIVPGRQYYVFLDKGIGNAPETIRATYVMPGLITFPVNHFSVYFLGYKPSKQTPVPDRTGRSGGGGNTRFSQYTIHAEAGAGGSISPLGDTAVEPGGSITYTVTADEGYQLEKVLIDNEKEVALTNGIYTFRNVYEPYRIQVTFTPLPPLPEETVLDTAPPEVAVNPATGDSNFDRLAIVLAGAALLLLGMVPLVQKKTAK